MCGGGGGGGRGKQQRLKTKKTKTNKNGSDNRQWICMNESTANTLKHRH